MTFKVLTTANIPSTNPVAEPVTFILFSTGIIGLLGICKRIN